MLGEKQKATVLPAALRCGNNCKSSNTTKHATTSSKSLKDIIGELILFLHGPITQSQRSAGWQLFKVLLEQYLIVKGEL